MAFLSYVNQGDYSRGSILQMVRDVVAKRGWATFSANIRTWIRTYVVPKPMGKDTKTGDTV